MSFSRFGEVSRPGGWVRLAAALFGLIFTNSLWCPWGRLGGDERGETTLSPITVGMVQPVSIGVFTAIAWSDSRNKKNKKNSKLTWIKQSDENQLPRKIKNRWKTITVLLNKMLLRTKVRSKCLAYYWAPCSTVRCCGQNIVSLRDICPGSMHGLLSFPGSVIQFQNVGPYN